MSWLRRNTAPIAWVLVAAAVVIFAFEAIETLSSTTPSAATEETGADLEGFAALAGLVKVALFLAVPAAITLAVHGRLARRTKT